MKTLFSDRLKCLEWSPLDRNDKDLQLIAEGDYVWNIVNFSISGEPIYSESFQVGDHQWRVLLKKSTSFGQEIGVFLEIGNHESLPKDWAVCARILVAVQSCSDENAVLGRQSKHRFTAEESDWGFSHMLSVSALREGNQETGGRPLMGEDGSFRLIARVQEYRDPTGVLWHRFDNYDSRKVTGRVGLSNQGATCYMNSLLQSLFSLRKFREAVYEIPVPPETAPHESIPLSLQRLFARLQSSPTCPGTHELTRSFGWDSMDAFMQHDVQEFSRVLLDELETAMKKSPAEGAIERLFGGKVRNVIRCLNVPFESVREEAFYDLQLTIRGVKDLDESLRKYGTAESLTGDNQYRAENYGLQDATRFVELAKLPPVLNLHLERYTFNPATGNIMKINDRFEFPLEIDLAPFCPNSPENQEYVLHSVLVHSGDSHGGHYFVFIRPQPLERPERWLKFDDTHVVPVTEAEAVQENFGGESAPVEGERLTRALRIKRFTNAYMLVYVRKSDVAQVLGDNGVDEIPAALIERIREEESAEQKRLAERRLQESSVTLTLITNEAINSHSGYDLTNFGESLVIPRTQGIELSMRRTDTLADLYEAVSKRLDVPHVRLWAFTTRRNRTQRIDHVIPADTELIGVYFRFLNPTCNRIYVEKVDDLEDKVEGKILVWFKFGDGVSLRPVCKILLEPDMTFESLVPHLCSVVDFCPDEELILYEELKPGRFEKIDLNSTVEASHICSGDIICFESASIEGFVPMYLTGMQSWTSLRIFSDADPDPLTLNVSVSIGYSEIVGMICEDLKVSNPSNLLLLLGDSPETAVPLRSVEGLGPQSTLADALGLQVPVAAPFYNLFYRLLDQPVYEFEQLLPINVQVLDGDSDWRLSYTIRVSYTDTASVLAKALNVQSQHYLLLEVNSSGRILREYGPYDLISTIDKNSVSILQVFSQEPSNMIKVLQYQRNPDHFHHLPFLVPYKPNLKILRPLVLSALNHYFKVDLSKVAHSFTLVVSSTVTPISNEEEPILFSSDPREHLGVDYADPHSSPNLSTSMSHSIRIKK